MLNYLKLTGAALIVAALVYGGWAANGWRIKAAQAEVLKVELRNELQRRVAEQVKTKQANDARLAAEIALQAKEATIVERVKVVKQTVYKHVKANPLCDIPDEPASQLQKLREGGD
jgi:C4-dicarboxylate-specific signal transduction histidine kinase